jgi:hypothetical protein
MILNWIDAFDECSKEHVIDAFECKAYVICPYSYYTICPYFSDTMTTYKCYYTDDKGDTKGDTNVEISNRQHLWRVSDAKAMCESHFQSNKKYCRDMKIDLILGMVGIS